MRIKKKLKTLLTVIGCMLSLLVRADGPIIMILVPNPMPLPPIQPVPLSLDDDEEAFTAMLYGSEEIVLTAETAESEVTVVVEGQNGEVYSSIEDMYAGESLEIDCSEWQSGFYTLYIYYRGETLYGVFRIR